MSEERIHHPYSPSKLQYLEACPCYESRQSEVVHERTTAGTKAHAVAETGLDDNSLGDDDAAAAAECLDFVDYRRAVMEDARRQAFVKATEISARENVTAPTETTFPALIELKETYLPIDNLIFPDAQSTTAGYIDHGFIAHCRTYAELFDWKFGMWPVEQADNNLQGLAYVLGILHKYPSLESVRFWFKQPHLQAVSDVTVTRAMAPAIYLRIQIVVARARAARLSGNFDAANPMVPVCNFCANIARCSKVAAFALNVARKFHPIAVPDNVTPTMIHSTRDTKLCLELSQVLAVWAKSFKTQVTDRVIRGEADMPQGYVLQQRADREVVNRDKYEAAALKYVTEAEYRAACSVTFGKIETTIKDKAPRGQKSAAVESFNKELLDSGAVAQGQPYTFLRAIATKDP